MITYNKKEEFIPFSPVELLEMSIIACLLSTAENKNILVERLEVRISNNKIRIFINCKCEAEMNDVVLNCYVLNHLNFEKIVEYRR